MIDSHRVVIDTNILVSGVLFPSSLRYLTLEERKDFLRSLDRIGEPIPIIHSIQACRDPKDDMILELAINGRAVVIVTGDEDLLSMASFHDVPIVAAAAYVNA